MAIFYYFIYGPVYYSHEVFGCRNASDPKIFKFVGEEKVLCRKLTKSILLTILLSSFLLVTYYNIFVAALFVNRYN